MAAMAKRERQRCLVAPPTLQARTAARLDHLPGPERSCGRAGGSGWGGSTGGGVQGPREEEPDHSSPDLRPVRKELISPEGSSFPGDHEFRFRHLLDPRRDLRSSPEVDASRAAQALRRALAGRERGLDLVEQDEVIQSHFERASRCKDELGGKRIRSSRGEGAIAWQPPAEMLARGGTAAPLPGWGRALSL